MRTIKIATLLASLTIGAASLSAQSTNTPPATAAQKHQNPARDSLRAVRQNMKRVMADRKAAKAAGDAARMKADVQALRVYRKQAAGLKSRLPRRKVRPKP